MLINVINIPAGACALSTNAHVSDFLWCCHYVTLSQQFWQTYLPFRLGFPCFRLAVPPSATDILQSFRNFRWFPSSTTLTTTGDHQSWTMKRKRITVTSLKGFYSVLTAWKQRKRENFPVISRSNTPHIRQSRENSPSVRRSFDVNTAAYLPLDVTC